LNVLSTKKKTTFIVRYTKKNEEGTLSIFLLSFAAQSLKKLLTNHPTSRLLKKNKREKKKEKNQVIQQLV
jgi:hypothetical protein